MITSISEMWAPHDLGDVLADDICKGPRIDHMGMGGEVPVWTRRTVGAQ